MLKGVIYALVACCIWGLIFVVPLFMDGFSSFEIALGRCGAYGIVSLVLFLYARFRNQCLYSFSIWAKALWFSLLVNIIYYICVVLALRYATAEISALILGLAPVVIAFYGNFKQKEVSYKSLIFPSLLIFGGLCIINMPQFNTCLDNGSLSTHIFGLVCTLIALVLWSWYMVANAQFLKQNPEVALEDWSTILGVATLFWVCMLWCVYGLFFASSADIEKYMTFTNQLQNYLLGSAILGFLCSWVGSFIWNKATIALPISLAGQLTIFETIFGVLFISLVDQKIPSLIECFGMGLIFVAILYSIQASRKLPFATELAHT